MMGFYAISLGQVALRQRRVFHAIGDGLVGPLKNLLPLIIFAVCTVLAIIALAIALAILVVVLVFIGKLVSMWLAVVLIVPLYLALLLALLTTMFGAMYHLWRDVCADDLVVSVAVPLSD